MTNRNLILIVDDQSNVRTDLKFWLERGNYRVHAAASMPQAKVIIEREDIHFAIVDLKLDYTSEFGGLDVVTLVKARHPTVKTIILSAKEEDQVQAEVADRQVRYDAFVWKGDETVNYIQAVTDTLEKLKQLDPTGLFRDAWQIGKSANETEVDSNFVGVRPNRSLAGHDKRIRSVTWSRDGELLMSVDGDHLIRIWSADATCLGVVKHHHRIWCVQWHWDPNIIIFSSEDGSIRMVDWKSNTIVDS